MKKILYVCFLLIAVSCGDSEYVKQLKSDMSNINTSIKMDSIVLSQISHDMDSVMMSIDKSDYQVLEAYQYEIRTREIELNKLRKERKDIQLEILKNK